MNFGGIYPECPARNAHFVVVSVPYDLTSTYQPGSRRGPAAIIEASTNMELYDEELKKENLSGRHPYRAARGRGCARSPADDPGGPQKNSPHRRAGQDSRHAGRRAQHHPGAVQAVAERYPDLTVLQLDAHADLRESYQGTPYNHACVARRVADFCRLGGWASAR
jgi:agmatinase